MCLKISEHLDIQIAYKILWLGFPKHSLELFFGSFHAYFLAIFMRNMVHPLGINNP